MRLELEEDQSCDGYTFSSLLSASRGLNCRKLGMQVHGLVIKSSYDSDLVVGSTIIDMYAKCGDISDARRFFDLMSDHNVVCWNSMIVNYGLHRETNEATKLFSKMLRDNIGPDELTLASVLSSCAASSASTEAGQTHCFAMKKGLHSFISVSNALISAHSRCGGIREAVECFRSISKCDIVSWSSLISAYAFHGLANEAIVAFEKMISNGVKADSLAFLGVLAACSHGGLVEKGLHYFLSMQKDYRIEPWAQHYACIVDLFGRAGRVDDALIVLRNMRCEPNADVLGALIGACRLHGRRGIAKWVAEMLYDLQPCEKVNYMLMSNTYAASGRWEDVARVRKMMRTRCGNKVPGFSWIEIAGRVQIFASCDQSHAMATKIYDMLDLVINEMKPEHD